MNCGNIRGRVNQRGGTNIEANTEALKDEGTQCVQRKNRVSVETSVQGEALEDKKNKGGVRQELDHAGSHKVLQF